jgi:tetratricopeptide (TPR) repeat protein
MARPKSNGPKAPQGAPVPARTPADGSAERALVVLRFAIPIALAVATLAAFWPSLGCSFVDLDDDANFLFNERFRGLGSLQLSWMWSLDGFHYGHWHPLTWTTFAIDYALYGRPQGLPSSDYASGAEYHRVGLFMHAATVVVLYGVALALLRWWRGWPDGEPRPAREIALRVCAALAALSWGLHPLRVESVAWLTERRDVLSTFFLLLAVLAYLRQCVRTERWPLWLALSLVAYAASLLCKAWGMTLPFVLLAVDVFALRRWSSESPRRVSWSRIVHEKLAYLPFAMACAYQAARAQNQISAVVGLDEHGLWKRVAQASYGLVWYPLKTLWPTNLSCMYLLELDFRPDKPVYIAAQVAVVVITLALLAVWRRFPAGIATWVCYGILVSPVLGLLQSGSQKVADRYAYLSAIPFSMLAAAGVLALVVRARDERGVLQRSWIALGASTVLACVLGIASHAQTLVWKDSLSLFENAAAVEPNYFVLHNLAAQYWKQQRFPEALDVELRSVAAHPGKGNEEARCGAGQLYSFTGKPDEAIEAWRGALSVAPDHVKSLQLLTSALMARSDYDGAVAVCEASLKQKPAFVEGWTTLANLHAQRGQKQKALETWQRANAAVPQNAQMQNGLGKALQAAGRMDEAEKCLVHAVELANNNVEFATDAAQLFLTVGRTQDAINLLQQVVNNAPTNVRARQLLDRALGKH